MAAAPNLLHPLKRRNGELDLLQAVGMAFTLVAQAEVRTIALALDAIGDIDLPDAAPTSADDQAMVRSAATLYLAAQLEAAGLIEAVETLCGLAVSGGLQVDLGSASQLMSHFWQRRNERFHRNERQTFFARLFGSDEDGATGHHTELDSTFENLMIVLCEALYKLDENGPDQNYGSTEAQAKTRQALRTLADDLVHKGSGMTPFAAKEILGTIQEAIRILQQPPVKHAFGANTLWDVVRAAEERYKHAKVDIQNYVTRGKSGLTVLSWAADSLLNLSNSSVPIVTLGHPVIAAAEEWLQSSLAIREAATAGATDTL